MRPRYIQSFSTSGTEQTALDNGSFANDYVAFIEDGQYIDWNSLVPTPPVPPTPEARMVATYNVTSTTNGTRIMNSTPNYVLKAELEDGTEIPRSTGIWRYTFPATGQQKVYYTIRENATISSFDSCGQMVDIYIPEGPVKLGAGCFDTCTGLTKVVVPNSVSAITDGNNFSYCNRIATIEIGSGLTTMGDQVFFGCSVLSSITIYATTPPTIGNDLLTGAPNAIFYVPDASVNAYKTAWTAYASIIKGISERP